MIDHFEYKVTSFSECKQVYEAALAAIGIELKWADDAAAGFGLREDKDRVMLLLEQAAADGRWWVGWRGRDVN